VELKKFELLPKTIASRQSSASSPSGEELPGGVKCLTFFAGRQGSRLEAIFKTFSPKITETLYLWTFTVFSPIYPLLSHPGKFGTELALIYPNSLKCREFRRSGTKIQPFGGGPLWIFYLR
jgi:hypothetical protein